MVSPVGNKYGVVLPEQVEIDLSSTAVTVKEAGEALARAAGERGVLSDIPPELLKLTAKQVKRGKATKILKKKWRKDAGKETIIDHIESWLDSLFRS